MAVLLELNFFPQESVKCVEGSVARGSQGPGQGAWFALLYTHALTTQAAPAVLSDVWRPGIAFLGLFDPVSITAEREQYTGHNVPCVQRVCVAYAIHERMFPMEALTYHPSSEVSSVWFPGSHGSVGGSLPSDPVSPYVLRWMLRQFVGLIPDISADEVPYAARGLSTIAAPDEWSGGFGNPRTIPENVAVHTSIMSFTVVGGPDLPMRYRVVDDTGTLTEIKVRSVTRGGPFASLRHTAYGVLCMWVVCSTGEAKIRNGRNFEWQNLA